MSGISFVQVVEMELQNSFAQIPVFIVQTKARKKWRQVFFNGKSERAVSKQCLTHDIVLPLFIAT